MKYIDADKLIAEIERLLKCTELHRGEAVADGSRQTLYWIEDFITSLQPEQPVEGLDLDIPGFEGVKVHPGNMPENEPKEQRDYKKLYEEIANSDWFKKSYVGKSLGEEAVSFDSIEGEMDKYYDSPEWDGENVSYMTYCRIARHFYELGCTRTAVMYDDIEYERQRAEEAEITKGLEEEYKDYVEDDVVYSKLCNRNVGLSFARHFAEWGAEHLKK